MESCITNRLNSLCNLYCNLEKKINDYLLKNETESLTKEELEKIKEELKSIKEENNLSIKEEFEKIKEELEEIKEENNLSIKEELEEIKGELEEIKGENNLSLKGELEIINGEFKIIKNDTNKKIKDELDSIKNTINSITHELRYQKNINLDTPNYLEYTLLYADFENCGICMYCPSEPYEPDNDISNGPIIDNEKYTILKNILNN